MALFTHLGVLKFLPFKSGAVLSWRSVDNFKIYILIANRLMRLVNADSALPALGESLRFGPRKTLNILASLKDHSGIMGEPKRHSG